MKRLFTICLVLLLCASAYGTKIADADDSTAIAAVKVETVALLIRTDDILAANKVAGDVFYVNSNASTNDGLAWDTASLTIEAAIQLCTADAGDWIMVHPSHAETASTGTFDVDKSGITIWGCGNGTDQPTISYDTATDTCLIGASGDGVKIHGITFLATATDVAVGIAVEAACTDFVIEDCKFIVETEGTDEFTESILTYAASDNGLISNCEFHMGGGGAETAISYVSSDFLKIKDCIVTGDYSTSCVLSSTTISLGVTIVDNILYNGDTGAIGLNSEPCIELKADDTGMIVNNACFCDVATPDLSIVAADMHLSGNTYAEAEGSVLVPGQLYSMEMTSAMTATDAMFTVAGGPIEIVSLFGLITTVIGGTPGDINIEIDATTASQDADFSTAVTLTDALDGDTITFATTTAGESVLVANANVNANLTQLSWFCPIGVITQALTSTGTGAITWYISFRPLTTGVTVVAN